MFLCRDGQTVFRERIGPVARVHRQITHKNKFPVLKSPNSKSDIKQNVDIAHVIHAHMASVSALLCDNFDRTFINADLMMTAKLRSREKHSTMIFLLGVFKQSPDLSEMMPSNSSGML